MRGGPQPFALREYALLADGERGVLIGPRGEMAWMCFPSWDSPSVFSALLGGPGHYQVVPKDDHFVWGGYYEPSSLIWGHVPTSGVRGLVRSGRPRQPRGAEATR
jgi:hypothetical protein